MTRKPFLETSQEKSQPEVGSGCCNTGCPTPTGNRIAAILKAPVASSSPTESQSNSPLDDTLEQMLDKGSGESGVTNTDLLLFWNQRIPVRMKG